MQSNKKQQRLAKLTAKQRKTVQKEYFRLFRRSLFTVVAQATGKDRAHVFRTWNRKFQSPDPAIEEALWAEVSRLICKEGETGNCPKCPLRAACERMAEAPKGAQ